MVAIDISQGDLGGDHLVTTQEISETVVDGEIKFGIPSNAFGATIVGDHGKVYIGANNADHDASTSNEGGFYKIITRDDGAFYMELLAEAPRVSSNDGGLDARGVDPFLEIAHLQLSCCVRQFCLLR